MMEFYGAPALFLDFAGTIHTSIEFSKLFVTEADEFTLIVSYALKVDWHL
jgi:hypothetical protein